MIGYYNRSVILTYIGLGVTLFGIYLGYIGDIRHALLCLILSGFCDMFDGKIARMTKRTKDAQLFGIQIDSLCDAICFGVLPAALGIFNGVKGFQMIFVIFFVIGGIIRLGYFNVMEEKRQEETVEVRKYYEGLPITATALLFPIYYIVLDIFNIRDISWLLVLFYLVVGFLFIAPIKVKKPANGMILAFFVIAIFVIARLLSII